MKIASIFLPSCASLLATATAHDLHIQHRTLGELGFDKEDTAVVVIDPQNDFLSPQGVTWGVVGEAVTERKTVEHIDMLFQAARDKDFLVFISPHYYYPHDKKWEFEGELEKLMHQIGFVDRTGPLSLEGFEGSGADWLEQYKDYIAGDNVIVTSPHKVYGPQTNDLALQLRKRGIDRIILGGMSANLCVESHLRELLEQGFDVYVVKDATAGPRHPVLGDGDASAMTNFGYLASGVLTTEDAITAMGTKPTTSVALTSLNGETSTNGNHDDTEASIAEQPNGAARLVSVGAVAGAAIMSTLVSMW